MINIIELCEKISGIDKGMHINEIAQKLMIIEKSIGDDLEIVSKKVSASLNNNSKKKKDSKFAKIPNGKGGFKAGMYKLKKKRVAKPSPIIPDSPTTQYTGKAGEYAVFSELLYWGFNPAMVTVDDGIDIIASKDSKYYHIQVKTVNEVKGKPYSFNIKKTSFERYNNSSTFYILVLRQKDTSRNFNDFIIIPNSEIERLKWHNLINENKGTYSFNIQKVDGQFKLNRTEKVIVNDFSQIK